MKMYIWASPYPIEWGASLLVAVAENEDAAREQAAKAIIYHYATSPGGLIHSQVIDSLGSPTRIINTPCAEIYEWEE